ncbi:MAG: aminoglycoside phosphotransferase family protein [Kiloniellaceae bacterium]
MALSNHCRPDEQIIGSLKAHGLLADAGAAAFEPLTGGVSSDIWKVEAGGRTFCVKRALVKLKVEAEWFAPVERNRFEVTWYRLANRFVPGAAPKVLAQDEDAMLFAMEFLDPRTHRLWKAELREGRADAEAARRAGAMLGRIHAGAARDAHLSDLFPPNGIFQAIRLEPYLEATALKHPDLKDRLYALSRRSGETRLTMIHGDVSPKNILLGPDGPVFLDAECACIGDPAFDLAFCLNHFLLKCLWTPAAREAFLACFAAMTSSYLDEVDWEQADALEARAASLLPGLFLARVDGKSPVEYITGDAERDKVRRCARGLLLNPPARLAAVAEAWREELSK